MRLRKYRDVKVARPRNGSSSRVLGACSGGKVGRSRPTTTGAAKALPTVSDEVWRGYNEEQEREFEQDEQATHPGLPPARFSVRPPSRNGPNYIFLQKKRKPTEATDTTSQEKDIEAEDATKMEGASYRADSTSIPFTTSSTSSRGPRESVVAVRSCS
ncbi:hypothetical protein VYU27_008706 [Nannochloropsis oceanica]